MFETPAKTMTLDEFLAFVEANQNDDLSYELHQGVLVEMPLSKMKQTNIAGRLIYQVSRHLDDNALNGFVASSDGGFKIPPDDFYAPDMTYYSPTRVPHESDDEFYSVAPDLAAEVVSTSDTYSIQDKARRYIELGVRLVWVVYPKRQTVDVYRPTDDGGVIIHTFKADDTLSGEDVLPGFLLPVRKIFGV